MQAAGVGRGRQPITKRTLAEHLRKFGQKLQVLLGRMLGHEQYEDLRHRLAVRGVERNRLARSHESAERALESLDAPVRQRDALTEPGRAELLAREQAVEHDGARDLRVLLEKLADLLEKPLLARRLEVEQDVCFRKQLGDVVHGGSRNRAGERYAPARCRGIILLCALRAPSYGRLACFDTRRTRRRAGTMSRRCPLRFSLCLST